MTVGLKHDLACRGVLPFEFRMAAPTMSENSTQDPKIEDPFTRNTLGRIWYHLEAKNLGSSFSGHGILYPRSVAMATGLERDTPVSGLTPSAKK